MSPRPNIPYVYLLCNPLYIAPEHKPPIIGRWYWEYDRGESLMDGTCDRTGIFYGLGGGGAEGKGHINVELRRTLWLK